VAGCDIRREAERLKEKVGYLPQRFGLYGDLTVLENIAFYADLYQVSRKGRKDRVERLLRFANLEPFGERKAQDLSGGMKQKLGLACVLSHEPKVLILDEPTSSLDDNETNLLFDVVRKLNDGGIGIIHYQLQP
jgi:ABC-2 type transport system ATP-binding protein